MFIKSRVEVFLQCVVLIPSKPRCWFLGSYQIWCLFQANPRC